MVSTATPLLSVDTSPTLKSTTSGECLTALQSQIPYLALKCLSLCAVCVAVFVFFCVCVRVCVVVCRPMSLRGSVFVCVCVVVRAVYVFVGV